MSTLDPILCEIHAPRAAQAGALAEIAVVCARDVGLPLAVKKVKLGPQSGDHGEAVLTLHLPLELAGDQHRVWCLACRLACFCPQARVAVLVRGETAFGKKPSRSRRQAAA